MDEFPWDIVYGRGIYFDGESPIHTGSNPFFDNGFFERVASYRTDSDIYIPYGKIFEKGQQSEPKYYEMTDWEKSIADIG